MATTNKPARLFYNIPSTWDIIPAFPLPTVGSVIGEEGSTIRARQPGRPLVLALRPPGTTPVPAPPPEAANARAHRPKAQWVPTQGPRPADGHRRLMPVLKPQEDSRSRLAIREDYWSARFDRSVPSRPFFVAHFIAPPTMLRGITLRVESTVQKQLGASSAAPPILATANARTAATRTVRVRDVREPHRADLLGRRRRRGDVPRRGREAVSDHRASAT